MAEKKEEELETTMVQLRKDTALRIKTHAEFGDTYDSIITRVLDTIEKKKGG